MRKIFKLTASIFLCLSIAYLGSMVTVPSINTWYSVLRKPSFNPPDWVFVPVWTTLYIFMGISLFLVWDKKTKIKKITLYKWFMLQLFVNFLWSFVFFYLHMPILALVVIILLWLLIVITILKFKKVSILAAHLLAPYLLWITFASVLNFSIAILNSVFWFIK